MSILVQQLTKKYGEQTAVNQLSFAIQQGEIVGFLGPNGAGKSTTMKMITGFLIPDEGNIEVDGVNVLENPTLAKSKIGYLPESNPLYYDMYVREYLTFIAEVHQVKEIKQRVEEVIEMVGLTPESKKTIGQLSKGYKQRVGLGAALIHDPAVLILDEPTTGLDPNQIIEIREVIKQLGRTKTVLFSSHILQEVEAICDRVVIINKGNLVANDRLSHLRSEAGNRQVLKVSFKEALEAAWLERLPAVTTVNKLSTHEWEVTSTVLAEAQKQIMHLAIENNLNIVQLQAGELSLEDIFRQLTGSKPV
ncbi:gliding motility-associated ABC transporter ATP-binding subunit GldA [Gynurincola endophyticus]|uniref:gliding motility-associated ABC transporter ATP-binding subunit GldA n=1 Tax=Gynurincola endophyticus TaxID=2479004 RepID=UPI000F8E9A7B|nr:gliding motility-associated ABC transporter ATP-binding subunit GldA [Gynurincola endophyticus]